MEPTLFLTVLLFGILGVIKAQEFYVVAPSSLRLNSDETIGIAADRHFAGVISVFVQDYPGKLKNITEKLILVNPVNPTLFKIRLDPLEFPHGFLNSPNPPQKSVSLNVQFENNHKEIVIPISGQSGYVFIQTDKPIYTPKERIYIRIIPLDEDSLPSHQPLRLQISNPNDHIVEQRELRSKRGKAFVSTIYNIPSQCTLGEWSAKVYYGHDFMQNSTIRFELQEYVLPFFTVELETPDILLLTHETITVKVTAKFSHGKDVKGFVSFRIGLKTIAGEILYKVTFSPERLEDGSFTLTFETKYMWDERSVPFSSFDGSRLYVEATVIDAATGNQEKAVDSKCVFASNPFDVSFKRCLRNFKPGFTTVVEADVTYKNALPAVGVLIKIEAVADTSKLLSVATNEQMTDENGRVSFEIQPEITHKSVIVMLKVTDERYDQTIIGTVNLQASESNSYIFLARHRTANLKPGESFARKIHFEPSGIRNIFFLVVARGKILTMEKLPEGEYKYRKVQFPVTYEMVPDFRILVFAHDRTQLLADSLKIEVENVCHPDSKISIESKFDTKEPGRDGKFIVKGTRGTIFGLIGVDETVYALSKKDLLTNAGVFNRLSSHDLGCGPGGGETIHAILGNAGVTMATNNFFPSRSHSCLVRKRKRRAIYDEMVESYTGFERDCCILGMENDPKSRSCEDRKAIVDNYLTEEEYSNCSKVFLECCEYASRHAADLPDIASVTSAYDGMKSSEKGRQGRRGYIEPEFLDLDELEEFERKQHERKDFKQTWFHVDEIIGPDKKKEVRLTLPDSITTWVVQGVSLSSSHGICVAEPQRIESTKKIFMHLNLPYSVVRNEQIEIQVTIFNYGAMPIAVTVYMYGAKGLCSGTQPNERSEKIKIILDAVSSETITFPVIPVKAEAIPVKVVALSMLGGDVVTKKLNVIPEGVTKEISIPIRLDPTNRQGRVKHLIEQPPFVIDKIDSTHGLQETIVKISTPKNFVPGTITCSVVAVGDIYGPAVETAVNNPEDLITMPGECGEQNMMKLAPTLYTVRYLKVTGKLSAASEENGYQYMRAGYSRQISIYRKEDGSYSAFVDRDASTWLTAFVMKVFCQASELIYIDKKVLGSGIRWLINNQQPDGSFNENKPVFYRDLMGGLEGRAPLTAFVLIALEECKGDENNKNLIRNRAMFYIENYLEKAKNPLSAAIIAYALALSGSDLKEAANQTLLSMATFNEDRNWLYWSTKNSAENIQTAGYALLTQLLLDDMDRSASIVNWLNTQQLESGKYESTQDTVIVLQAMSEYAIRTQMPSISLETNISSSNGGLFIRNLILNEKNALVLQNIKIANFGGSLFLKTKGSGVGSVYVKLRYNIIVPPEDVCKFDINIKITNKRIEDIINGVRDEMAGSETTEAKSTDKKLRYNIRVCVRYLGDRDTEMSIVDVGLFTGFLPIKKDLEKIENDLNQLIQKCEITARSVVFYLEKIPSSEDYCFSFNVVREFIVGNTQMTAIKVYDYYNPNAKCTKFYKPESTSPLIRTLCIGGICQCAEGGCPPRTPFAEIRNLMRDERRAEIKESICADYDYAWIAELSGEIREDGNFLNISVKVKDVIKAGIEKAQDVLGETRTFLARENCVTARLYKTDYLILGQDGQRYMDENGVPWYRYLLDQASAVYMWVPVKLSTDVDFQRDLNYVARELKSGGCDY